MSRPLLLIGPRLHGVPTGARVCFEMLLDHLQDRGVDYRAIDLSGAGGPKPGGTISTGRIAHNLGVSWRALLGIPGCRRVYLIISMSKAGALRDLLVTGWAALWNKPYTLHLHGGGYESFLHSCPWLLRALLNKKLIQADRILVLSPTFSDDFALPGMDMQRVRAAPNGLPANSGIDCAAKCLDGSTPVRLLFLSNMIKSKGYRDLLEACHMLFARGMEALECHFCGAFPPQSDAEERQFLVDIASPVFAGKVRYHGSITGEHKIAMLRDAHLLVLPTRYPGEGQPMAIIEALASATPVIATAYRSIPELLGDGECGVLIAADDHTVVAAALADAIESLAKNPQRYAVTSLAARARFEQHFRAAHTMSKLVQEGALEE